MSDHKDNVVKVALPDITSNQVKVLVTLGNIVRDLQKEVDPSEIPKYYVDPRTVLDYLTEVNREDDPNAIPERVINSSLVPIDWIDNTPVVNGLPIWERLDCEPLDYYKIFKIYREQKVIGVPYGASDPTDENVKVRYNRSFDNLEKSTNQKRSALYALSKVYHWHLRIICFDRFREDLLEKERTRLIALMENKHRVMAQQVFDKCMIYIQNLDEKGMSKFSPREMVSLMQEATKMDRLSLGIPADKPLTEKDKEKITKVINYTKTENKTLNINQKDIEGKDTYLQEMLDILQTSNALPKSIEAKAEVMDEIKKDKKEDEVGTDPLDV